MKIQDFFRIFFGSDFPGFISIWDKQTKHSKFFRNCELDSMSRYIKKKYKNNDLYFGCGLRADKEMPGRGKHENIIGIPGFWMDLDLKADVHKSDNYPVDKIEAYKILHEFPLAPTIVNSSGYGLHLFWLFEKPWIFRDEKERNEAHVLSGKFQDKIISLFKNHGYILDKTADLPRILRIPSTLNHKKDSAVPVKIVRIKDEMNRRYTLDAIRNAINNKSKLKSRVAKPIKNAFATGTFPNSNVENILQRCQWFHHCQMDSRSLSEPEWFAMLTIITFCENPLSWAYDLSKNYDGFSQ
ncbi:MAG: hypothetical protein PHY90_11045, partial [Desulfitobacteriaceae bacterium]|nr:hypothetical protein [Desulfitobacteriaceae bacterium]